MAHKAFDKILTILHQRTSVDFSLYKQATLRRRIARRMMAHKFKSLDEYFDYLLADPVEIKALFNDILIQVTSFFRDPFVFKWLEKHYLSELVRQKISDGAIRIWVPACSTGEEVYSLAIALAELTEGKTDCRLAQLFGTDINEAVLEKARAGVYGGTIKKQVSPEQLERFFEPVSGGFRVQKTIRDVCIFARHSLAADPPFSNLDLISCRNVLIYMEPALQRKIIPILHFGLKPNGVLLLGASETIGDFSNLFATKEKKVKAYSKREVKLKTIPEAFLPSAPVHVPGKNTGHHNFSSSHQKHLKPDELRVVVDSIIRRNTGVPPEEAHIVPLNMPNTADKIYFVFVDSKNKDNVQLETSGVKPLQGTESESAEVARLRHELLTVRESMQAVIEQGEATNEELRAANEEIVSSNEEMQSTNEELESAKEELQSANEELSTVNNELENRNVELEQANLISNRYMAIVESSEDAIIGKDLNGIIQTWNKGAERIFGYAADEVLGKPITILIPPENYDEETEILARLRAGERIDHYETVRKRKDGRLIDISLTVSPIKNRSGQIVGASKIARDVTDKKRASLELKRAQQESEKANRAKDDFLATLSHELRTPLTPVLLIASDAVADLELPPGIRANFDVIRRNVELEARLIDDLLDLTRVTAGKLKMETREVNIHAILSDAISIVQSEIEQKKITLSQKLESPQSFVLGDQIRLQQIFWNVLKNAVKFTPPNGKIAVHARVADGYYVVTVSDTGIGMTAQELARAFDAFKQGEHSTDARRFGGLGLGLTISKKFAELHSGTIEAFSEGRDLGSTITIKLPLLDWKAHSVEDETKVRSEKSHRQANILLVEDHEPTRTTLARLLISRGHKVVSAASVQGATAFAEKHPFDLVISDIGLPDGDGYNLFSKIRDKSPNTKGIALSGFGMHEDLARSKSAGFCAHLVKPVEIRALEEALVAALIV